MEKSTIRICALITDFGTQDYFIGTLKGVMKRINPGLEIIDLTNDIPSYTILAASFTVEKTFHFFPCPTIFLVVVDPGVGSDRNLLLIEHNGYYFIGPDNSVLTPILHQQEKIVYVLDKKKFFLNEENSTFEARDKMAPVAAHLSLGVLPGELGTPVTNYIVDPEYEPKPMGTSIEGRIVYIDKFGNMITNISRRILFMSLKESGFTRFRTLVGPTEIRGFYNTYNSAGRAPFMLIGSHLNLEIAINQNSAAQELNASVGQKVVVKFF